MSAPRASTGSAPKRRSPIHHGPLDVAQRTLRLVDRRRTIRLPDGRRAARTLLTEVRYPLGGQAARYPLIVFGHGFTVTPDIYAQLLRSWVRGGYVVAAPLFPLENAHAPGGPNEKDLVNQPADVSFVISALLRDGRFRRLIDPRRIAVAGQSDGGETALAVAYDRYFRDPRVRAAVILSGAQIPGRNALSFQPASPPLLAVQGTADTINPLLLTERFFGLAPRPKFLLELLGAGHLAPYTDQQPQLGIVERATAAFLDRYLKGQRAALVRLQTAAGVSGKTRLIADP